jgi:hypothetical protein
MANGEVKLCMDAAGFELYVPAENRAYTIKDPDAALYSLMNESNNKRHC